MRLWHFGHRGLADAGGGGAQLEGGDHPEVALAAAAQRPAQVGLRIRGDAAQLTVCGDDLERLDVVGGVPVPAAHDRAVPAAEVVADNAHGRRADGGEPVLAGLADYLPSADAPADAGKALGRIGADLGHPGHVDQYRALGGLDHLVPRREDGHRQVPSAANLTAAGTSAARVAPTATAGRIVVAWLNAAHSGG